MENPAAAREIIVDPDAVYGYSPSPDTVRLTMYLRYDFKDLAVVNELRDRREEYHESIRELYQMILDMKAVGKSTEEIARAVSKKSFWMRQNDMVYGGSICTRNLNR